MKNIAICIGTRPNMIKVTQFKRLLPHFKGLEIDLIHTGQHYDDKMAQVFFDQFNMRPDHQISLEAKEPAAQMGEMMLKLNERFKESRPDLVLVPGDVNSTFAAALTAFKMNIPVGHIESGLRSFDRTMPEELNRILTDEITDHFFVTEPSGLENLRKEGKDETAIHFVGNTMIDTLVHFDQEIEASCIIDELGIESGEYGLLTFHRPANVDNSKAQQQLIELLREVSKASMYVFPVHPRTKKAMESSGLWNDISSLSNIILTEPLGYFEFQQLVKYAKVVITDSGGIQEETTYRKVPCITLRPNTERPITTSIGSNVLLPFEVTKVMEQVSHVEELKKHAKVPDLWDGRATYRILKAIHEG